MVETTTRPITKTNLRAVETPQESTPVSQEMTAAAPTERPSFSLWSMLPLRVRIAASLFLFLTGTTTAAVIANLQALWGAPARIDTLETKFDTLSTSVTELNGDVRSLLRAMLKERPASFPSYPVKE